MIATGHCAAALLALLGGIQAGPEAGGSSEGFLEGMSFVRIPSGSFMMGSVVEESGRYSDELPAHEVVVESFELMTTEVTQGMWQEVMGELPGCDYGSGPDYPVYWISWEDCQVFIQTLDRMDPRYDYRLPSEAEWEYACRAGSSTTFYWGTAMDLYYCWFDGNSDGHAHPVASRLPNAWGLYDMSGNVYEWCGDWYHGSYSGAPETGDAWVSPAGSIRVRRGGSWLQGERNCRSADRNFAAADDHSECFGFRLVRTPEPEITGPDDSVPEPEPGTHSAGPLDGMDFVWIPSGAFEMGSALSEEGREEDEGPVHSVELRGFELMTTEVTQGMWREAFGRVPLQEDGVGPEYPISHISEEELEEFLDRLEELDTGHEYRLPSEAQWEYACRAGTSTPYYWGEEMDGDYCWFLGNSGNGSHPVGQTIPNAWGLFDMSGNGYEVCEDSYHESYDGAPTDGLVWLSTSRWFSVYRGGGWGRDWWDCRSASRMAYSPGFPPYDVIGFRLARFER